MTRLSVAIVEALLVERGRPEVLRRLADPFWFQAFGAVMGMDWHSSGITTSVMGALKGGLADRSRALGLWVCGGRTVFGPVTGAKRASPRAKPSRGPSTADPAPGQLRLF